MTLDAENATQIEESWERIRGEVRRRWPQLTQDDLKMIDGDPRKLVALVHQKTGDRIDEIEDGIDEIAAASEGLVSRVTRSATSVAAAAGNAGESAAQAVEFVSGSVSRNPATAMGVACGAGFLIGLSLAGLLAGPPSRRYR